jgi:hypothetical protein
MPLSSDAQCPNGHSVRAGARFCPACGAPTADLPTKPITTPEMAVDSTPQAAVSETSDGLTPRHRTHRRKIAIAATSAVLLVVAGIGIVIGTHKSSAASPTGTASCVSSNGQADGSSSTEPPDPSNAVTSVNVRAASGLLTLTLNLGAPLPHASSLPIGTVASWVADVFIRGQEQYEWGIGESNSTKLGVQNASFSASYGPITDLRPMSGGTFTASGSTIRITQAIRDMHGLPRIFQWNASTARIEGILVTNPSNVATYIDSCPGPTKGQFASFPNHAKPAISTSTPSTPSSISDVTTPAAPTTIMIPQSGSYFSAAKAAYQDGVNTFQGYKQAGPWLSAASDLASDIASGGSDPGFASAERALRNLATLPDAMAQAAQRIEFDGDFSALNLFFDTPGLYGVSRSPFHVATVSSSASSPDAPGIISGLSDYFTFVDAADYLGAYDQLGPDEQKNFTEPVFATNESSTSDSNIVLSGVTDTNQGGEDFADVTFTSHQNASQGPDGDTCDNWSLQYEMDSLPSGWVIDQTTSIGSAPTSTPC